MNLACHGHTPLGWIMSSLDWPGTLPLGREVLALSFGKKSGHKFLGLVMISVPWPWAPRLYHADFLSWPWIGYDLLVFPMSSLSCHELLVLAMSSVPCLYDLPRRSCSCGAAEMVQISNYAAALFSLHRQRQPASQ